MTSKAERIAEYQQGEEQGYDYASEIWNEESSREYIACLIYREPAMKLRQHIEQREGFGLEDEYYHGFAIGMRKALDERDANAWLTALPGYH